MKQIGNFIHNYLPSIIFFLVMVLFVVVSTEGKEKL
jgi:hypothetical protein